jgi:small-conductance mechanosensitive channel
MIIIENILLVLQPYILPILFLSSSIIIAIIFNRIIIKRLEGFVKNTDWDGDDVFIDIIHKYAGMWIVLAGIFLTLGTDSIPLMISNPLSNILIVVVIFSGATALSSIITEFVNLYTDKIGGEYQRTGLFNYIIKGIVMSIGILMILQTFGISITPILGALGVGSMAAGFALKDTLANLFSGIQILLSKQIKSGDLIRLSSGLEGYITDITLRNTTLVDRTNNTIVVPNSELAVATIVNYSIPKPNLKVKVDCGVAYDSNLEQVEQIATEVGMEVMKTVSGGVTDFNVIIRFHTFNDSSIDFTTVMQAKDFDSQYRIKHEFIKKLKQRFDENNIEIPFPIRTIINS